MERPSGLIAWSIDEEQCGSFTEGKRLRLYCRSGTTVIDVRSLSHDVHIFCEQMPPHSDSAGCVKYFLETPFLPKWAACRGAGWRDFAVNSTADAACRLITGDNPKLVKQRCQPFRL
jgi:hypothetical protein